MPQEHTTIVLMMVFISTAFLFISRLFFYWVERKKSHMEWLIKADDVAQKRKGMPNTKRKNGEKPKRGGSSGDDRLSQNMYGVFDDGTEYEVVEDGEGETLGGAFYNRNFYPYYNLHQETASLSESAQRYMNTVNGKQEIDVLELQAEIRGLQNRLDELFRQFKGGDSTERDYVYSEAVKTLQEAISARLNDIQGAVWDKENSDSGKPDILPEPIPRLRFFDTDNTSRK